MCGDKLLCVVDGKEGQGMSCMAMSMSQYVEEQRSQCSINPDKSRGAIPRKVI